MKFLICLWGCFMAVGALTSAVAQTTFPLYEHAAPGSETWEWTEKESAQNLFNTRVVYNVVRPSITAFLPDSAQATGAAVVIAPGGGFHVLSMDSEGIDVARWLNSKGVAAFVLKYRLVHSFTDDPVGELIKENRSSPELVNMAVQDGMTAMRFVRQNAVKWRINPGEIGIMGFSAGGTVAMGAAYHGDAESRPNFVVPVYPYMPAVPGADAEVPDMPAFIVAATDDQLGLAPQSVELYNKWVNARQPAELHLYEKGGHGFGLRHLELPSDGWIERLADWMKMHKWIDTGVSFEQKSNDCNWLRWQNGVLRNDWANLNKYQEQNMALTGQKRPKAVFMGNSITEFWVYTHPDFFTKNNFVGRGISGQTSPQMLLRFRQDVIDLHPETVVICAGINDIAENTGPYHPEQTINNIISMAQLAQANGIKVVLASVHPATQFPWRPEVKDVANKIIDLNARIKAYADKNGFRYVDYHSSMKNAQNGMNPDMAEDGVHPTAAGYSVMEKILTTTP